MTQLPTWPRGDRGSMIAFYGNPDANGDGVVDPAWFAANIVRVRPPFPMYWSWETSKPIATMAVHRRVADSLLRALSRIPDVCTPKEIEERHLNRCGGAYNFRPVRGTATSLSTHAYGAAIDLAPQLNGLGAPYSADPKDRMIPLKVVELFTREGWVWGGRWRRPDAMHFQAALV